MYSSKFFILKIIINKFNKFIILLSLINLILIHCTKIPESLEGINNKIEVITLQVENIKASSADLKGIVNCIDQNVILRKGFVVNTSGNPNINGYSTDNGKNIGNYQILISLNPETKYYVRAYAVTIGNKVLYGNEVSFLTKPLSITITTVPASSITEYSATSGGSVSVDAGSIINRGVCYSKEKQQPTLNDNCTYDGGGNGTFQSKLINLMPNTRYYYRAYCSLSNGKSYYGNSLNFITSSVSVTINSKLISVTENSAQIETNFTSNTVLNNRGLCYSLYPNPDINNSKIYPIPAQSSNIYTNTIPQLSQNTQYYIRAFAYDNYSSYPPHYGNILPIKTKEVINTPTLNMPVNGSTVNGTTINFKWSSVPNIDYYILVISTNNTFPQLFQDLFPCNGTRKPNISTSITNATTPILTNSFCMDGFTNSNSVRFYWRVRSRKGNNLNPWSSIYYFDYKR